MTEVEAEARELPTRVLAGAILLAEHLDDKGEATEEIMVRRDAFLQELIRRGAISPRHATPA